MQHSEEGNIIFEISDVKCITPVPETYHPVSEISPTDEHAKMLVRTFTENVNQKMQFCLKGKRGENTAKQVFKIFECIWFTGVQHKETYEMFKWIPLSKLSEYLIKSRRIGRPVKNKYNYNIVEDNPIPHPTTMRRLLDRMVEAQLIEKKVSNEKSVFYRISLKIFEREIPEREKIDQLEQALINKSMDVQLLSKRLLAVDGVLECNRLRIPIESIENWIEMWDAGDRTIVKGYGPQPTPFKVIYNPTGNILEKGEVFSDLRIYRQI